MAEDGGDEVSRQVQARFVTKLQDPFKVPNSAITIPANLNRLGLSAVVNGLIGAEVDMAGDGGDEVSRQVQARFVTKLQDPFKVPNSAITIPANLNRLGLSAVVNGLIGAEVDMAGDGGDEVSRQVQARFVTKLQDPFKVPNSAITIPANLNRLGLSAVVNGLIGAEVDMAGDGGDEVSRQVQTRFVTKLQDPFKVPNSAITIPANLNRLGLSAVVNGLIGAEVDMAGDGGDEVSRQVQARFVTKLQDPFKVPNSAITIPANLNRLGLSAVVNGLIGVEVDMAGDGGDEVSRQVQARFVTKLQDPFKVPNSAITIPANLNRLGLSAVVNGLIGAEVDMAGDGGDEVSRQVQARFVTKLQDPFKVPNSAITIPANLNRLGLSAVVNGLIGVEVDMAGDGGDEVSRQVQARFVTKLQDPFKVPNSAITIPANLNRLGLSAVVNGLIGVEVDMAGDGGDEVSRQVQTRFVTKLQDPFKVPNSAITIPANLNRLGLSAVVNGLIGAEVDMAGDGGDEVSRQVQARFVTKLQDPFKVPNSAITIPANLNRLGLSAVVNGLIGVEVDMAGDGGDEVSRQVQARFVTKLQDPFKVPNSAITIPANLNRLGLSAVVNGLIGAEVDMVDMAGDGGDEVSRQVQARFVTKLQDPFKVPNSAITIPANLNRLGLSAVVNGLIGAEVDMVDMAGDGGDEVSRQVQARFVTKLQDPFKVPNSAITIPANLNRLGLSAVVNGLIGAGNAEWKHEPFDFLINGELVRMSLEEFLLAKGISAEKTLEIEYIRAVAPRREEEPSLHDDWVSAVDGTNSEFVMTGCYDGLVRIWRAAGLCSHVLEGHSAAVTSVGITNPKGMENTADAVVASASKDRTLRLWKFNMDEPTEQPTTVRAYKILRGHTAAVQSVAAKPSGDMVCSGSWDCRINLWDTKESGDGGDLVSTKKRRKDDEKEEFLSEGAATSTLVGHTQCVSSVVWPQNDTIYSASWDHLIKRWDVETGQDTANLVSGKVINCLDVGGESNALVAAGGSDPLLRIWDPRKPGNLAPIFQFSSHTSWISSVKWHNKSWFHLVTASYDGKVMIWDLRTAWPVAVIDSHQDKVLCADWWRGDSVVSGGADSKLCISSEIGMQ